MREIIAKFDALAAVGAENKFARTLERVAFVFLILMFVFAPHSIAATQIAWLTGMFVWLVRQFIRPRLRLIRTPLDAPLWIFFAWSVITSIFSYDPPTSLDKLRNVALFLIFYFVINIVRTRRAAVFLAGTLILSSMVSVIWTPIERVFGRGVQIISVSPDSLFTKAKLLSGDTLLAADDKKISSLEDLLAAVEATETTHVYFYRPDYYWTVEVHRADLLDGANALEKFGIGGWQRGRNWRSAGFLSHYATFAEILQLVLSLTFGLFAASLGRKQTPDDAPDTLLNYLSTFSPLLLFCIAAMALALLLTSTRASQIGFIASAFAVILVVGNRKILLLSALLIVPIALGGLYFVQQSRHVGFVDPHDDSTRDRLTFYRKGWDLWTDNARNFSIGIGMDSSKRFIKEWNLYDNQGAPMGHFHSTPLQLLVERGLPALFLWLWVLWVYGRTLLRRLKIRDSGSRIHNLNTQPEIPNIKSEDWREKGIILGAFGGFIGFVVAGFVHYNLGTAQVAMVFFMLMGLSCALIFTVSADEVSAVESN